MNKLELYPEQQRQLNRIIKGIMIETTHCILSGIEDECKMARGVQKHKIYDSAGYFISEELHTKNLTNLGVQT
ncbi:hypothetical protein [Vibrio owensii]|uniref:hypothetical protein n=1 Tax=Vibrio owensii TaxID=696485 RepID=UPI003AAD5D2D